VPECGESECFNHIPLVEDDMDLGLKGKVALVAGGSMGLGRAVALELVREGAKVAIGALDDPHLNEAARLIRRETGIEVLAVPADVSDAEQAKAVVRKTIDHYGTLDILINNAGGPPSADFIDIDETLWEKGFRLNLLSTILMTREAVPVMKAKGWGRIINMTSISVKQPIDGLILSNTIRSGVIGLAKSLSNELAPFNVTVNSVCPGYTLTDRVRNLAKTTAEREGTTPEAVIGRWEASIPMKRLGTPEEFSALVAFLASERSGYITGAAIQIDGGWYKGVM
jgi:3-oxoacyl-[acyl-carrier protein] reductase